MYKVLLVDDENIFLNFMSKVVDWTIEGCEIVGTASDGEQALSLILSQHPDVVFLDINMSGMNGLEVCRKLTEERNTTKIIITTAHNEFSFAQKAIKLNVFDYLLKPFDKTELLDALHRCIEQLKKEQAVQQRANVQKQADELKIILEYGLDDKRKQRVIQQDARQLTDIQYLPVILKSKNNTALSTDITDQLLAKYIDIYGISSYALGFFRYGMTIIHQFGHKPCDLQALGHYYKNLLGDARASNIQNVCFGEPVMGLMQLNEGYAKAKIVTENSVKFQAKLLFYQMIQHNEEQSRVYTAQDINELIKCVEQTDNQQADHLIARIFGLQDTHTISFNYIISVYHALVARVIAHYHVTEDQNLGGYSDVADQLLQDIKDCSNHSQILSVVNNAVYELFSDFAKVQSASKKDVLVTNIEGYLAENYQNSELTVSQIAVDLFFENSYIRRVYKLQCGKTIMNKLEEIRIKQAKKLLNETSLKNSEIAQMCGFSDQYYFSKRFKLTTGKTPSEYKVAR